MRMRLTQMKKGKRKKPRKKRLRHQFSQKLKKINMRNYLRRERELKRIRSLLMKLKTLIYLRVKKKNSYK